MNFRDRIEADEQLGVDHTVLSEPAAEQHQDFLSPLIILWVLLIATATRGWAAALIWLATRPVIWLLS